MTKNRHDDIGFLYRRKTNSIQAKFCYNQRVRKKNRNLIFLTLGLIIIVQLLAKNVEISAFTQADAIEAQSTKGRSVQTPATSFFSPALENEKLAYEKVQSLLK